MSNFELLSKMFLFHNAEKRSKKEIIRNILVKMNIVPLTLKAKVFFVTLKTKGGSFRPTANSETKEARTMKLCTVIVYYIASITK